MTTLYQNWQNSSNTSEQYGALFAMLERAEADKVLDIAFTEKPHNKKEGRSVRMARWAVPATNTTAVSEGVNNASRNLVAENVYATLNEYSEVFAWSSQADEMDPLDYEEGAGEVGADLVMRDRTALKWAAMIAGTQKIYNSSSITARADVNGVITGGRIEQGITIVRNAKGSVFKDIQLGSNKVGSSGLMPSFYVFGHENLRYDIENLPRFQRASDYPSDVRANTYEIGSVAGGRGRVILSPELEPVINAGATYVAAANLRSTGGANYDVYPIVIVAKNSLACVPLRGKGTRGQGNLQVFHIKDPDRTDPAGLTRLWSCKWNETNLIVNELWVCRIEVACTNNFA